MAGSSAPKRWISRSIIIAEIALSASASTEKHKRSNSASVTLARLGRFLDAPEGEDFGGDGGFGEFFPVVFDVEEFAGDVVGFLGGEEEGEVDLFLGFGAAGVADLFGVFDFLPTGILAGAEDFVGHGGVGTAGAHGVGLYVVVAEFLGDAFDEANQGGFGGGVGGEIRPGAAGAAAGEGDDLALALFDHAGKNNTAGIDDAEEVGVEGVEPRFGVVFEQGANGALDRGGANQDIDGSVAVAHEVDDAVEAFKVADVGGEFVADAAGVFDFEVGEVEFGGGAGDEANAGAGGGEADGEAFADAAASAGDDDVEPVNGKGVGRHGANWSLT